MLMPAGLSKSERAKYIASNKYILAKKVKRVPQNKHPGLRVAGATGAQAAKQKVEAKTHKEGKRGTRSSTSSN